MSETPRVCTQCGDPKDLKDFPRHKSSKGGRLRMCSECRNRRVREKRARGQWLGNRGWNG
jgi:hypothetical protein